MYLLRLFPFRNPNHSLIITSIIKKKKIDEYYVVYQILCETYDFYVVNEAILIISANCCSEPYFEITVQI